jgi:hypothetical protein
MDAIPELGQVTTTELFEAVNLALPSLKLQAYLVEIRDRFDVIAAHIEDLMAWPSPYTMAAEFYGLCGDYRGDLELGDRADQTMRVTALMDAMEAYVSALNNNRETETAEAMARMMYVILGTALAWGIPMEEVFADLHRSEMTKFKDDRAELVRPDGRPMKGPSYQPPETERVINEYYGG